MSGKLIMNALVMYDHQTDTLWSQFLGEGVKGPLIGKIPRIDSTYPHNVGRMDVGASRHTRSR